MINQEQLGRYLDLFCHHRDIYAVQKTDGSYFLVRKPITYAVLRRHLTGEITCGWYAMQPDHTIRWAVLDADQEDGLMILKQVWEKLGNLNLMAYLEDSRRGGHLWVCVEPIHALVMRTLMRQVLARLKIDEVEIYPRQDEVPPDGVGSMMRGPLGFHQLTHQRYLFIDPVTLHPIGSRLGDQFAYLRTIKVNSVHQVAYVLAVLMNEEPQSSQTQAKDDHTKIREVQGDTIEMLKVAIGDLYTFVSQYVELDAKGRGSCPFHPPDRHPSFAVNREKGYWVCFHETNPTTGRYRGGDAIEFYRQLKGIGFKEAVRELARQYGLTNLSF